MPLVSVLVNDFFYSVAYRQFMQTKPTFTGIQHTSLSNYTVYAIGCHIVADENTP